MVGFLADRGAVRSAQSSALRAAGCLDIRSYEALPEHLVDELQQGDELVVWRLDELGLAPREIIDLIARLSAKGIGLRSVVDRIDTLDQPVVGEFCLLLAMLQKKVHKRRVVEGIEAARKAGLRYGRTRKLTASDVEVIQGMVNSGEISVNAAARSFGVGRSTLQRYLAEARDKALKERIVSKTAPARGGKGGTD